MAMAGEEPDIVIGCVGGGSNFAGLAFPFVSPRAARRGEDSLPGGGSPAACPTLTRGVYRYDFGDTVGLTPLMAMYTLGTRLRSPGPCTAGGPPLPRATRPMLCGLVHGGLIDARAYGQNDAFAAAVRFARNRGDHPRTRACARNPRRAIDEAEAAREAGEARVILFGLSGHGHFRPGRVRRISRRRARGPRSSPSRTWKQPSSGCRKAPAIA